MNTSGVVMKQEPGCFYTKEIVFLPNLPLNIHSFAYSHKVRLFWKCLLVPRGGGMEDKTENLAPCEATENWQSWHKDFFFLPLFVQSDLKLFKINKFSPLITRRWHSQSQGAS